MGMGVAVAVAVDVDVGINVGMADAVAVSVAVEGKRLAVGVTRWGYKGMAGISCRPIKVGRM